jgi:uncharacterized membrane protein YqjE
MEGQDDSTRPRGHSPGMFDSLKQLLATFAAIAQTRIELLGTEVEEQVARLSTMLLWTIVCLFLAFTSAVLVAVAVLIVFWDSNRVLAAVVLAAGFALLALISWLRVRTVARGRPHLFQATMAELAKDRDRLGGR